MDENPDVMGSTGGRQGKRPGSGLVSRLGLTLVALGLLFGTGGAGCSVRKLGYSWAGRLVVSRFVDTFGLDSAQKRDLLPRIAAVHEWHRRNELPRYVQLLDAVMDKVKDGLEPAEVEWMMAESSAAVERLARRFAPEAGAVLSTLTDEQISQAVPEMKKGERERFERLELSENDYIQYRLKMARKNLTNWLGSYSDAQLAEFEKFVRKNRIEELRRRKRTQANQEALLATLRQHPGAQVLSGMIYNWLTRQEVAETPDYQQAEKLNQAEFVKLVVAVDHLMTPEQRRHLLNELRGWRSDFYELANGI